VWCICRHISICNGYNLLLWVFNDLLFNFLKEIETSIKFLCFTWGCTRGPLIFFTLWFQFLYDWINIYNTSIPTFFQSGFWAQNFQSTSILFYIIRRPLERRIFFLFPIFFLWKWTNLRGTHVQFVWNFCIPNKVPWDTF